MCCVGSKREERKTQVEKDEAFVPQRKEEERREETTGSEHHLKEVGFYRMCRLVFHYVVTIEAGSSYDCIMNVVKL